MGQGCRGSLPGVLPIVAVPHIQARNFQLEKAEEGNLKPSSRARAVVGGEVMSESRS